mgnify:CR=1 FL=1|tara:strand:+ start:524 stop:715 length:192 start_codon:yes stop_codon:yes gene_type:complete
MKVISRSEIHPIKMATNPPQSIVNCGMKVINTDKYIYEYVGIGWVKSKLAEVSDYLEIPQLID